MQNALARIRFTQEAGIQKWVDSLFALKGETFFRDGIRKLQERWQKAISSNGEKFE